MRIASHSFRSRSVHGFGRQSPARALELTEWELAFAGTWMPTAAAAARMRPGTTPYLRGASRRWRDTWRHRRYVDVARDANANNAKIIKDAARALSRDDGATRSCCREW